MWRNKHDGRVLTLRNARSRYYPLQRSAPVPLKLRLASSAVDHPAEQQHEAFDHQRQQQCTDDAPGNDFGGQEDLPRITVERFPANIRIGGRDDEQGFGIPRPLESEPLTLKDMGTAHQRIDVVRIGSENRVFAAAIVLDQRLYIALEELLRSSGVALDGLLRLDQMRFDTLAVITDESGDLYPEQQACGEQDQSQITSQHQYPSSFLSSMPVEALLLHCCLDRALRHALTLAPQAPLARFIALPVFVLGQWLGGDNSDHVVRRCFSLKIDNHVDIFQPCRAERRAPGDLDQFGTAKAKQPVAIAQQAVEHAFTTVFSAGLDQ
ncbi:hypothetical protein ALP47_04069 [Pseudomonas savastanoi]|nr:hypothetical protein ALP47_04069 [Pseudomonas savastanoi]